MILFVFFFILFHSLLNIHVKYYYLSCVYSITNCMKNLNYNLNMKYICYNVIYFILIFNISYILITSNFIRFLSKMLSR